MKLINILRVVSGVFLCALVANAAAEDASGIYALSGGGKIKLGGFCADGEHGCKDSEWAYSLGGGYQFNRYVALDAAFLHAEGFDKIYTTTANNNAPLDIATTSDFRSYLLGARLMVPVDEHLSFYGKVGAHLWKMKTEGQGSGTSSSGFIASRSVKSDITDLGVYYSVGGQYAFESGIGVRAEYSYYQVGGEANKPFATSPHDMHSYMGSLLFYF